MTWAVVEGEEIGVIGRTHRRGLQPETRSLHRARGCRGEAVSTAEVLLICVSIHQTHRPSSSCHPVFSDWILGCVELAQELFGGGWVTAEFPSQGPPMAGVAGAWAVYQDREACAIQARSSSHRRKQPSVPGPHWVCRFKRRTVGACLEVGASGLYSVSAHGARGQGRPGGPPASGWRAEGVSESFTEKGV